LGNQCKRLKTESRVSLAGAVGVLISLGIAML
jgi:hypothetical protein